MGINVKEVPHYYLSEFEVIATLLVHLSILELVRPHQVITLCHYELKFIVKILSMLDDQGVEHYLERHYS